jgi:hypothetical protein
MKKSVKFVLGLVFVSLLSVGFTELPVPSIAQQRTSFWDSWISKCFPDKDWSKTTFKTIGEDYTVFKSKNKVVYNDMKALNPNEIKLQEFVESGSTMPEELLVKKGDGFFKIVPKGNDINGSSAYYLSRAQLDKIKGNAEKLEQMLGLPLSSVSAEYDVFEITYEGNKGYVFQSRIAPTQQYANATPDIKYTTTGDGMQTLILDNMDAAKWKKSAVKVAEINPSTLPDIGNQIGNQK